MLRDLRLALRTLGKSPGPTAVVVGTLAVAIAAGTMVYSTIDVVAHLVPIANRDRMVFIPSADPRRGPGTRMGVSIPDLADLSQASTTIEAFAGFALDSATLTGVDVPARVSTLRTTANLPSVWGLQASEGRLFGPDDGRAGAPRVAVLTSPFRLTHFSGNPAIVGTSILLNGEPHTIIGVLPPEASVGLLRGRDLMVPMLVVVSGGARDARDVFVTARLKEGVSREAAAAEVDTIARRLQAQYPVTNADVRIFVLPLIEMSGFNVRFLLFVLALVAVLVVAMACANVMNVVLAQATARWHERAIRAALGATRMQLIRPIMVEGFITASLACGLGVLLASWGLVGLRWTAGADSIGFADLALNRRVLAAASATAFVAPFLFALLPALRSSRASESGLKDVGRSRMSPASGGRTRRAIIAIQVGLAMILLIQVTVLVRAALDLTARNPGFEVGRLLTFRVDLASPKYAQPSVRGQFFQSLLERIGTLPGVVSAGAIDRLPVADDETMAPLMAEGQQRPVNDLPLGARALITPGYRRALEIPLVRGRDLTDADASAGSSVALVSEETVRRFWPGESALGRRLGFASESGVERWLTIVGVIGNVRSSDVDQNQQPQVYTPALAAPASALAFVVRTSAPDPLAIVPAVRAEVARLDPDQPIHDVQSMAQIVASDLSSTYVLMLLLGAVALVALCLASAGVYGVVSYAVTQRTREIGVRMALGATPAAIQRLIAAQGGLPAALGGLVGLVAAVALVFAFTPSVAGANVRDPTSYLGVVLCIALVALGASYVPSRRASRVDPAITLRAE